jgi:putative transposase
MSAPDRRGMLDARTTRCRSGGNARSWARSGVYRQKKLANDNAAALMRHSDELFTAWPFLGSRRMTAMLREDDLALNRKRVQRPMRRMGIAAPRPKPRTTKPAHSDPGRIAFRDPMATRFTHTSYAMCRSNVPITRERPTSPIFRSGAVFALSERLSTGRAARFCHGGCRTRWTSARRWKRLARNSASRRYSTPIRARNLRAPPSPARAAHGVMISMDGRGRWMDNVFIERLWRSLKHEDIYLKGYADGFEARLGIAAWMEFYNRPLA